MFDYWKVRWFLMFPPKFTEETLANAGCFLIWSLFLCCSARLESLRVSQQQKQVQHNSFRSWYRNSTIAVPRSANVRQFPSSQTPWRHVTMHHWIWLEWPLIEIIPLKSQGSHVIPCCLCFIVNCLWIWKMSQFSCCSVTWQVDWLALLSHPLHLGYLPRRQAAPVAVPISSQQRSPVDEGMGGPTIDVHLLIVGLHFPILLSWPYPRAIFGRLPDSQTLYDMILVDIPISLHLLMIFLFSNWFIHSLGNNKPTAKTSSFSAQTLNPSHPWGHRARARRCHVGRFDHRPRPGPGGVQGLSGLGDRGARQRGANGEMFPLDE